MKTKKIIALLVCCVLISIGFAGCKADAVKEKATAYFAEFPDSKNVISAADFLAKVNAGDDMTILDIRQADVYGVSHVKGAINIPFGKAIAENLKYIPNDKTVYVYCYTGQTASQTIAVLNVAGIKAVSVQSGFTNGISKVANYESSIDTVSVPIPTKTYTVDSKIQAAVTKYYDAVAAAVGTKTANLNISAATLKEAIDAGNNEYYILSVRKAEDYAKGHIKGAKNIPFGKGMQEKFGDLPKDKKIAVYCYTGQTASQTVGILRLLGYDAYNVSGGMGAADTGAGWLGAGFEVVTD